MSDYKVVMQAVFLCRSMHETPSATRVINVLRSASSRKRGGMNRGNVCRLIAEVCRDFPGTVGENPETVTRPESPRQETVREIPETPPRHHARIKTIDYKTEINITRDVLGDDEAVAVSFLGVVASKNASGKLTESRELNLRRELLALRDRFQTEAWRHGLRDVIRKEIDNVKYAEKVMAGFSPASSLPFSSPDDGLKTLLSAPVRT